MSLVTRCPSCTTTFKVVRDQLRISDGWVRCGRCSHVFDASLDLRELSDAEAAPAAFAAQPPEAAPTPDLEPEAQSESEFEPAPVPSTAPNDEADFFDDAPMSRPQKVEDAPIASLPPLPSLSLNATTPVGLVADEPWPEPRGSGFDELTSKPAAHSPTLSVAGMAPSLDLDPVSQVQLQKALRNARIDSVKSARAREKDAVEPVAIETPSATPVVQTASESEVPALASPTVPSFLRVASSSVFWRNGKGRAIVWSAVILAALLLMVQVLHRERDTVVASQPGLRPLLESICAVTGCELAALRRIGDITIDGTSFAREKAGDGYQFSFTLRNAATVPLSMPSVELSLLNTQEQVVVRRVLLPAEFGAPTVLPARSERAVSLPLILSGTEAAALPPIAGFNVVAFYP